MSLHDLQWVRRGVEISQEKVGQISKVASFWEEMGKDVHLGVQRRDERMKNEKRCRAVRAMSPKMRATFG